MSQNYLAFLLIISAAVKISLEHSHGGTLANCNNLNPSHQGAAAQTTPFPYAVIPGKNVIGNGKKMTVEIRGIESGVTFNGFMLQARTISETPTIFGQFQPSEKVVFNFRDCLGLHTTVTNANNDRHESLIFEWAAPLQYVGKIRFQ